MYFSFVSKLRILLHVPAYGLFLSSSYSFFVVLCTWSIWSIVEFRWNKVEDEAIVRKVFHPLVQCRVREWVRSYSIVWNNSVYWEVREGGIIDTHLFDSGVVKRNSVGMSLSDFFYCYFCECDNVNVDVAQIKGQ